MDIKKIGLFLALAYGSAPAGVELLNCRSTDEVGKEHAIKLTQSGHASNQYEAKLSGTKITVHQYGAFGSDRDGGVIPMVSFNVEDKAAAIHVASPGLAQAFPSGVRYVQGPTIKLGNRKLTLDCYAK